MGSRRHAGNGCRPRIWSSLGVVASALLAAGAACTAFSGTTTSVAPPSGDGGGADATDASSSSADAAVGSDGASTVTDAAMAALFCPIDGAAFCDSFDPPGDPLMGLVQLGAGGTSQVVTDVSRSPPASYRLSGGTETIEHVADVTAGELELDARFMLKSLPTDRITLARLVSVAGADVIGAELYVDAVGAVHISELCGATGCVLQDNDQSVADFTWPLGVWIDVDFIVDTPPRVKPRTASVALRNGANTSTLPVDLTLSSDIPGTYAFTGTSIGLDIGGSRSIDAGTWTLWTDDVVLYARP